MEGEVVQCACCNPSKTSSGGDFCVVLPLVMPNVTPCLLVTCCARVKGKEIFSETTPYPIKCLKKIG